MTQNSLRITGAFWALDTSLAYRRHFPAISWIKSYTLYLDQIQEWYLKNVAEDWRALRDKAMGLLQKEVELQEIVQLVGPDALPDFAKAVLETTRMLPLRQTTEHPIKNEIARMKEIPSEEAEEKLTELVDRVQSELRSLSEW
jgi:vacuolar-type H+-ATPase catalytic subunit A/Vma1